MKILGTTSALINPAPAIPHQPTTASVLLESIASALNKDGCVIEPTDIDDRGMRITTCDGFVFRLDLDEGELMDDADWQAVSKRAFEAWVRRDSARHARTSGSPFEPANTSWMGECGDDIEF